MSAAEVQEIKDYVAALLLYGYNTAGSKHAGIGPVVEGITAALAKQAASVAALTSLVQQATAKSGQPIDLATIQKAAAAGAADAIKGITVTVEGTTKP